ncbi:hypothetical protein [Leptospira bouyouniensis]|uniref:Uncharacterized protein n=1 Tax=Leptospira bouyouniensis TaxID=2484911 RepID=A0A7I0HVK6_9LEPT|nr:hypothetical protein [Leptospira bouyouniensis]TGL08228.1 hypothetical protein EHQ43_04070 [Leptospira bouyouniensis]TGM87353.1 hypothetical protein EHQ99_02335 [Leptospira bouyouniensis]
MPNCFLGTSLYDACPPSCRHSFAKQDVDEDCIAKSKLEAFLQDKVTFKIGFSAFSQIPAKNLEKFLWTNKDNLELITYFLYIGEPTLVREIIETFSNHTLSYLFKIDFENYMNLRESIKREKSIKHMFDIRSFKYWTFVSYLRICDLIQYFVRYLKEPEYACQFLTILPSEVVSNLSKYTGLDFEEEKSLYTALGDSIYELPLQSPKIYDHMLQLFAEDPEVSIILSTMEELVRRQNLILETSAKLTSYISDHRIDKYFQYIFSELNGIEIGTAEEILNQLLEKKMITPPQKRMIIDFLETGKLEL